MNNRTFIVFCLVTALMATSAFAAGTAPATGPQQPSQPQLRKIPPVPTAAQVILTNTNQLLKQVAALTTQVNALTTTLNTLTKAQSGEAAMVADMAKRLQATCFLLGSYQMTINSNYGISWCWGRTHPNPADVEAYSPFGTW
jgi:hypothetical protein